MGFVALTTSLLSTLLAAAAAARAARSSHASARAATSAAAAATSARSAKTSTPPTEPVPQPTTPPQKRPFNWEKWTAIATSVAVVAALAIGIPTTVAAIWSADAASDSASSAAQAVSDAQANADNDRLERKSERERRYAELVVFSTSMKDNRDRLLTVRNLGPVRITKPALVVDVDGIPVRVPLSNVKACSSSRYVIDSKWFESGQVKLVFEDANGLWWARAESEPLDELGTTNQPWGTGVPVDTDARPIPLHIKGTSNQPNRTLNVTDPQDSRIDANHIRVDRKTYAKNLVRRSYRWYVLTPRTKSDEWKNENECPAQP